MVVQTIHRLNCLNMVVQTIYRLNYLNIVVQTVQGLNCLNIEVLAWFPISIYIGPCPPLGTSCSIYLIVTNRSYTSHYIITISCYQTRLALSLLIPSRDTYTYRRSLPIYQSRNIEEGANIITKALARPYGHDAGKGRTKGLAN